MTTTEDYQSAKVMITCAKSRMKASGDAVTYTHPTPFQANDLSRVIECLHAYARDDGFRSQVMFRGLSATVSAFLGDVLMWRIQLTSSDPMPRQIPLNRTAADAYTRIAAARIGSMYGSSDEYLQGLQRFLRDWQTDIQAELDSRVKKSCPE